MRTIEAFQMKKIYAVGHALGITEAGSREDGLHSLVYGVAGKDSVRALTYREAAAVIARLEELQGGAASPRAGQGRKPKEHPSRPGGVTAGQQRKIWALMYDLKGFDASAEGAPVGDRLCAVIKKELGTDCISRDPFAWLTFRQGNRLIEVLKGYIKSAQRKEAAGHGPS